MAAPHLSTKRLAISKANAQMVAVVAVATFVSIFCLIASKTVFSQVRYQSKVSGVKEKAHHQLQDNIKAFSDLQSSYTAFDATSTNVIGGTHDGTGDNDGPNSKIILDALPSNYDFPALASSLEKILSDRHLHVVSINGTDDQLNQQGNNFSPTPQPISIPFSFSVNHVDYQAVKQLVDALQKSIRPIQVDVINLTGAANDMTLTVNAHTFFQPATSLTITKQVVK